MGASTLTRGGGRGGGGGRGRGRGGAPGGRGGFGRSGGRPFNKRRAVNDTAVLPASLTEQFESPDFPTDSNQDLDARFNFRFTKRTVSRKDERKAKRMEKKQRVVEHHSRRKGVDEGEDLEETVEVGKKRKIGNGNEASGKKARIEEVPTNATSNKKPVPATTKPTPPPTKKPAVNQQSQLDRLAESNPAFYSLLSSQNLVKLDKAIKPTVNIKSDAFANDDQDIEQYAKKLKIKGGKMPSAFTEDGLDELFKGLLGGESGEEEAEYKAYLKEKRKAAGKKDAKGESGSGEDGSDSDEDMDLLGGDDDSDLDNDEEMDIYGTGINESDLADSDSDQEMGDHAPGADDDSDLASDSEADEDLLADGSESGDSDDSEEDEFAGDVGADSEESSDLEDQDESEADKHVTTTPQPAAAASTKYIPPHLRKQLASTTSSSTIDDPRLQRHLQGLLNRLSSTNISSILTSIEELYRSHPRATLTNFITDSVITFIGDHANLLDSYVMTYAALVAGLYQVIGTEFGATLIQKVVEDIISTRATVVAEQRANEAKGEVEVTSKKCLNLVTLASYLYTFDIVANNLLYDLIRTSIGELSDLDVEILLRVLRIAGISMRSDDPLALKQIVTMVNEQASKRATPSSRFKFMVEMVGNVKNNLRKKGKSLGAHGAAEGGQEETLKKFVAGVAKRGGVGAREPLRVGVKDIMEVGTRGKWWIVGGVWNGNLDSALPSNTDSPTPLPGSDSTQQSHLLSLSRAQKLNTDIRRQIFLTLLSSEDCIDALQRLLKLGLKPAQEREIVRVLIHCLSEEKVYNPYYALVGERLCAQAHGYRVTFQYVLWDSFKAMEGDEEMDVRRVSHLAKLYAHLVAAPQGLQLTILKSLTYTALSPFQTLFLKLFLFNLFTRHLTSEDSVRSMVSKAAKTENVVEGLGFFIRSWAKGGYDVGGLVVKEAEQKALSRGCKVMKEVFTAVGRGL
ncbi:hypothetical protein DFS34DRAFT_694371 [Phlyctochytrium arcticum]|nr:hypothetical protein DFS34DRAFT_694371 [Phlyctochytrium arcticum]